MSATLRERALRLLARREHSREELRRKLSSTESADIDANALAELLDDLAARRLLSDERFAEQRATVRGTRYGNARLKSELRQRGVAEDLIAPALEAAGDETARANTVWQRKFGKLPESREEWARQARFLQARGFSGETIRRVLRREDDNDD